MQCRRRTLECGGGEFRPGQWEQSRKRALATPPPPAFVSSVDAGSRAGGVPLLIEMFTPTICYFILNPFHLQPTIHVPAGIQSIKRIGGKAKQACDSV